MSEYTDAELNLIILASLEEFTYGMRMQLLDGLQNSEPDFVKSERNLVKTLRGGVYNKLKDYFYSEQYRAKFLCGLQKRGIECVTYFSQDYPELLRHIPEPPHVLFCKGDARLLTDRCFSVVGSRKTPPQTLKLCKEISAALTDEFTVVTGFAEGADTAAVEGALPSGRIISVIANGFDFIYPSSNARLFEKMEKKGLLITEYPPHIRPAPYRFPVRNRIIAGLSEGTLIVSAGRKSGALITANLAADYSRDVFALPYAPGAAAGEGCNALIKKGAYLAENILDIFSVYGLDFKKPEQNERLTEEEAAILKAVRENGEAFLPDIAKAVGKPPHTLMAAIASLEMKGLITRLGGNRYA